MNKVLWTSAFAAMFVLCLLTTTIGAEEKMPITPGLISCESYSLRELIGSGQLTLLTFPAFVKNLGITGVTLNDMFFESWDKDYLDRLKQAVADAGCVVTGMIIEGNLATGDEGARRAQIEEDLRKLRAAAYLGAPVVRINIGGTDDEQQDPTVGVERVVAAFREMLPVAKELGVKITIENHGGVSKKADWILRVIKGTDPKWVGSCLDFGNWPDEVRYEECRKLAPYAYHVHAKAHAFDESGEAEYDFGRILATLRAAGCKAALSIEWEGGGDPVVGVEKSRDLLLKYWPPPAAPAVPLEGLIAEGATVERVATGFEFTEGPAWDGERYLYFSDIPAGTIYRFEEGGSPEVFLRPSGMSNGLMFDGSGNIIACRHDARDLALISPSGEVRTLAATFRGRKFNSPNDCYVAADGSIYFTDPNYGLEGRAQEQELEGVYRLAPDGSVSRIIDDLVRPNGLCVSADATTLYVADTEQRKIRGYPLLEDGSVGPGRDLAVLAEGQGGPDGMAVDVRGNLYVAAAGILVFDSQGKHLGTIAVPEAPANCTFGGADDRTLYITARHSLYRIHLTMPGLK